MKRKSKKSVHGKYVNQCVKDKVPVQDETSKWEYKVNIYIEDDQNCEATMCYKKNILVCSDKNCQETPNIHMWSVEPASYKKMCSDKNCKDVIAICCQ